MADKENAAPVAASGPRLTRAAAKRAAAGSGGPSRGAKRKRVALAELPIAVSNAAAVPRSPSPHLPVKPAATSSGDEEQHADRTRRAPASPPASAEEASSGGGDSQLCGSYASDIYTYLRTMEVLPHSYPTPLRNTIPISRSVVARFAGAGQHAI
jgi:cyclin A